MNANFLVSTLPPTKHRRTSAKIFKCFPTERRDNTSCKASCLSLSLPEDKPLLKSDNSSNNINIINRYYNINKNM